jgi:hypothetical protein
MQWQSPLIVLFLFMLRLALPLYALLGIGVCTAVGFLDRFMRSIRETLRWRSAQSRTLRV